MERPGVPSDSQGSQRQVFVDGMLKSSSLVGVVDGWETAKPIRSPGGHGLGEFLQPG